MSVVTLHHDTVVVEEKTAGRRLMEGRMKGRLGRMEEMGGHFNKATADSTAAGGACGAGAAQGACDAGAA